MVFGNTEYLHNPWSTLGSSGALYIWKCRPLGCCVPCCNLQATLLVGTQVWNSMGKSEQAFVISELCMWLLCRKQSCHSPNMFTSLFSVGVRKMCKRESEHLCENKPVLCSPPSHQSCWNPTKVLYLYALPNVRPICLCGAQDSFLLKICWGFCVCSHYWPQW